MTISRVGYGLYAVLAVAFCVPPLAAQQTFETAAIHPSHETPGCTNILPPASNHFELTCVPLRAMVQLAFQPDELEGEDKALDRMYDLRAITPAGTTWTMETVAPLLRTLLMERFHLTSHVQAKSVAGFDLVVGRHGSRMKPSATEEHENKNSAPLQYVWADRLEGRGVDADGVAGLLGLAKHAPVVNRTGLGGRFDIDLRFAPQDAPATDLPEFNTAVKEQLGLELKPAKVPITVMVVDHVDTEPSSN